ncbi:PGG domain [Sesbania bispinosa]|nr:PGG domain [Sesbania bispinosa]
MESEDRAMMSSTSRDVENTNESLFKMSMKGKWGEVVNEYKENKKAHKARITRSGDTALHVAVSDGQESVVEQLVKLICNSDSEEDERKEALRIQNERRNTALHYAASMGSVQMCRLIASAEPSLLTIRNVDGETPLFLAALHGNKEAFLSLHYIWLTINHPNYYANCGRNDGDTILHVAIAGDYFDLAFQIIQLYGELVNRFNERGSTPLHLLASKPSAFKSGRRLGRIERLIYHSIIINKLEQVAPRCDQQQCPTSKDKINYPENYEACMELWWVIKRSTLIVIGSLARFLPTKLPLKDRIGNQGDLEASKKTAINGDETKSSGSESRDWSSPLFPANYTCCVDFFKFVFLVMLVIFGRGSTIIRKIRRKKEKHTWSAQILDELLKRVSTYKYDNESGNKPQQDLGDISIAKETVTVPYAIDEVGDVTLASISGEGQAMQQKNGGDGKSIKGKMETPILIAAKNGVTEIVEKILEMFPVAIHDMDAQKKNIVLLAVENRQPHLYEFLRQRKILKESIFRKVDNEGNSALHLAAKLGDNKPWLIPGEALQMHWEIKWYLYVKESMPPHFFHRYNKDNRTPREVFSETHKYLVKSGVDWLNKTSESCSLVAALIATVAFATSTTVPGGVQESTGEPTLEKKPAFNVFAISSLVALCCSVTSLVLFLSILTSRYQESDFGKHLPRKLILGLTSLFMSITSMLVSFCAGHFFVIKDELKYAAYPVYAVICLPVTLFALAQFPLYFDLIWATFKKVPQRSYKTTLQ